MHQRSPGDLGQSEMACNAAAAEDATAEWHGGEMRIFTPSQTHTHLINTQDMSANCSAGILIYSRTAEEIIFTKACGNDDIRLHWETSVVPKAEELSAVGQWRFC